MTLRPRASLISRRTAGGPQGLSPRGGSGFSSSLHPLPAILYSDLEPVLKIDKGAGKCPPRRGSGRSESPVQRAFSRIPRGEKSQSRWPSFTPNLLARPSSWPCGALLPGPVSSSSHSREGLGVPWPDLFGCFCVSGCCAHPWLGSHVCTCPYHPSSLGWSGLLGVDLD